MPKYEKNDVKIFDKLKSELPIALQNAKKLKKANAKTDTVNPYTNVDLLVEYLMRLKD